MASRRFNDPKQVEEEPELSVIGGGQNAKSAQGNNADRAMTRTLIPKAPLALSEVLRLLLEVTAATLLGVEAASAQTEVIRCLPPEVPMTELPVDVLAEYRTEIATEIEAYFAAISGHIACLDQERARAMDEARAATEAYTILINTIPATKDFP